MTGVPGNCHALGADRAGQFSISVFGPYRLIFVPDLDPLPTAPDGSLDRVRVTRILVVEVVDYHGH